MITTAVILLCRITDNEFITIKDCDHESEIEPTSKIESFTNKVEEIPVFKELENKDVKYTAKDDMRPLVYTDIDDRNALMLAKQLGSKNKVAMDARIRLDTNSFDNWKFYKKELDEDYANGKRPWWNEEIDFSPQYINPSTF